jgi:hypothetical protein
MNADAILPGVEREREGGTRPLTAGSRHAEPTPAQLFGQCRRLQTTDFGAAASISLIQ